MRSQLLLTAALVALGLAISTAAPPASRAADRSPPPVADEVLAGGRLAQRHCGGCHGMAGRPSPFPDAPAFETLRRRYAPGCLDSLLTEGMLAPLRPDEEGSPRRHPRMPQAKLEDDEVAALRAYLRSLDPRPVPSTPACGVHPSKLSPINKVSSTGSIL